MCSSLDHLNPHAAGGSLHLPDGLIQGWGIQVFHLGLRNFLDLGAGDLSHFFFVGCSGGLGQTARLLEQNRGRRRLDDESKRVENELVDQDWYVLTGFNGTSEERNLISFLKDKIGNLKSKYDEVYLLRNEEVYKIYDFEKGRGFQPDFLLFLKHAKHKLYYQVFIEPKGSQFIDRSGNFTESKEAWKEEFLAEISKRYFRKDLLKIEDKNYKLVGLPLFNENIKTDFDNTFNKNLLETI